MTGGGILKTTTVTTTAHTASAVHGIGADIIALTIVHGDIVHIGVPGHTVHIGTDGDIATGAATDILTLGTMTHGITEDGTMVDGMTRGTTEDTMDGIALTTAITSTTDGTTHITIITDMVQDT